MSPDNQPQTNPTPTSPGGLPPQPTPLPAQPQQPPAAQPVMSPAQAQAQVNANLMAQGANAAQTQARGPSNVMETQTSNYSSIPTAQQQPPTLTQAPAGGLPQANGQVSGPQHTAPSSNPNSTQNTLQIAEIRDGIVIMNDGTFRSVIMCKSVNFDLMSPEERSGVEAGYQAFLNSLYFDVQIFVHSTRVDIRPYLEKLDKIRSEHDNMLLAMLMDDYIGYIDRLAEQANIMDKTFYIVVPYEPTIDLQKAIIKSKNFFTGLRDMFNKEEKTVTIDEATLSKAKDELRERVQSAMSGLMQCGVQGIPLDTQELIELYYDVYNPDTATRQQLTTFGNLTSSVIGKGEGDAPKPGLDREMI